MYFRNELKAQFRALYGQSQASLPTYYSSYLPISYHLPAAPQQTFQESVSPLSPPGDSRRRPFSPERLQTGSRVHPYYVMGGAGGGAGGAGGAGGHLDRRAQPANIQQRRMVPVTVPVNGPDLTTSSQLQQESVAALLVREREMGNNQCLIVVTDSAPGAGPACGLLSSLL